MGGKDVFHEKSVKRNQAHSSEMIWKVSGKSHGGHFPGVWQQAIEMD